MGKADLDPKLQALADKAAKDFEHELVIGIWDGKISPEDALKALRDWKRSPPDKLAKDVEREIILMGIREGKFSHEDVRRHIRAGEIRPEVAKELEELWFKSAPPEPRPKPTRKGKQMPRLLPVLRDLYPPKGIPPDHVKTVTVMQRVLKVYEVRGWGEVSRETVQRAIGRRKD